MLTIIADYVSVKIGGLKLSYIYPETRDHERLGGNANWCGSLANNTVSHEQNAGAFSLKVECEHFV